MSNRSTRRGDDDVMEEKDIVILLESSYPLLKLLREKCPGTFKHSQYLSSFTDSVCTALDLDPLPLRVASMYHDIGKIINPKIFSENQLADDTDPHEKMEPIISAQLITRHVADSVIILINDGNFPREILQMISQHHGNSLQRFFFKKSGGESEDGFRYHMLTRPNSIESAILMICDIVESKSRSKIQKNEFNIGEIIQSTFEDLDNDHQIDDVTIRYGDLGIIKETLAKELEGLSQKRNDPNDAKSVKNFKEKK